VKKGKEGRQRLKVKKTPEWKRKREQRMRFEYRIKNKEQGILNNKSKN